MTQSRDPHVPRDDGNPGVSSLPAAHRFAILTCMDARIDSAKLAGLRGSEGHVIRNAGARATEDAIRSLVLSHQLLGTREWYVVQHSQCGMALLNEELMHDVLQHGPRGARLHKLALSDQEQSLVADVERIRNHPLVPADVAIRGFILDVDSGRFVEVAGASESGPSHREVTAFAQAAAQS
jgi:carbonic anhydrase